MGGDVLLRADLVTHDLERATARTDEDDPGVGARGRELRVLGQEPVSRVDRLRAGLPRCGEDRRDVEIGLRLLPPGRSGTAASASRTCGASASASL